MALLCSLVLAATALGGCGGSAAPPSATPTPGAKAGSDTSAAAHTCATTPTTADEIVWAYPGTKTVTLHPGQVLGVALSVPAGSELSSYPWAPVGDSSAAVLRPVVPFPGTSASCVSSQSLTAQRFAFRAGTPGTATLTAAITASCPPGSGCGVEPLDLTVTVS